MGFLGLVSHPLTEMGIVSLVYEPRHIISRQKNKTKWNIKSASKCLINHEKKDQIVSQSWNHYNQANFVALQLCK